MRIAKRRGRQRHRLQPPNHELAIFVGSGCAAIYLTDGGTRRADETRQAWPTLASPTTPIFAYTEASLYDALLDGNLTLYREVADRVRQRIDALDARQVFRRRRVLQSAARHVAADRARRLGGAPPHRSSRCRSSTGTRSGRGL
jgi:hypothetical protein